MKTQSRAIGAMTAIILTAAAIAVAFASCAFAASSFPVTERTTAAAAVPAWSGPSGPAVTVQSSKDLRTSSVHIKFTGPVKFRTFYLTGPDRLVIDAGGALLTEKNKSITVNAGNIASIRLAQNQVNPNIVRIVVDLKSDRKLEVKTDDEKGVATIGEATAKAFPQVSVTRYFNRVEFRATFDSAPNFSQAQSGSSMCFQLHFPDYSATVESEKEINDGVVKSVTVGAAGKRGVLLSVNTRLPASVDAVKSEDGRSVTVVVMQSSLYGQKVVVDAGHGGKDPGAMSPDGAMEKEVVLEVALRLRRILETVGASVVMTREDDRFVVLDDRAYIANVSGAPLFLSIHANALPDHAKKMSVRGIQMLYNTQDSKVMAQVLLDELAAELAIGSIGLSERNKLVVLRKTRMPAVLAEIGFITHPHDKPLLMDDTFRENIARGLFNGLQAYMGGRGKRLLAMRLSSDMTAHLAGKPSSQDTYASAGTQPSEDSEPAPLAPRMKAPQTGGFEQEDDGDSLFVQPVARQQASQGNYKLSADSTENAAPTIKRAGPTAMSPQK